MKYLVYQEWSYSDKIYEHCNIKEALEEDIEYDGYNMVSGAARNGLSINIYNTLEDAIIKSHFNPEYITFDKSIDRKIIKNILRKYIWNKDKGLIPKEV